MKLEKITDRAGRRYHDACGAAHGLDLIGERWALLVIRELMMGPRRFGDLRKDLHGISANVLTQRLEGLEQSGILTKRRLPPPANAQVYELTPWGYEAEVALQVLGRWAVTTNLGSVKLRWVMLSGSAVVWRGNQFMLANGTDHTVAIHERHLAIADHQVKGPAGERDQAHEPIGDQLVPQPQLL